MRKSDHEHLLLHALFLVFHQSIFVSVVFDFNALNNDALPVTPKVLSVDLMRLKKRCLLIGAICSFLLSHHSDQVE